MGEHLRQADGTTTDKFHEAATVVTLVRQEFLAPDWYPEGKYVYEDKDVLKITFNSEMTDYDGSGFDNATVYFVDGTTESSSTMSLCSRQKQKLFRVHQSLPNQFCFKTF